MFAGIDIGGTNIKAVITNREGLILASGKERTPKTAEEINTAIVNLLQKMLEKKGFRITALNSIGIGAAGAIDGKKGIIITSPNIQAWKNYPLAPIIEKKTGVRTFLENDATAAVIGEWWIGHGKKFKNWIMLTLGTGIGGGAVIDNKVYTGQSGSSMEVGHLTIDYKGKQCPCGNRGCFERYASATALVEITKGKLKKNKSSLHERIKTADLTARMIFEEAKRGDKIAREAFDEVGFYLGIGLAGLVNIFNPEAIILGGGLSRAHQFLLPIAKKVVAERALPGLKDNVKYLIIKNEDKTPALGAAKVGIDSVGI
ncbi:MAG: ROK family protein [Spirochaetes bacterium]|nr:ROK family protein [Spirochaetota bacterium]